MCEVPVNHHLLTTISESLIKIVFSVVGFLLRTLALEKDTLRSFSTCLKRRCRMNNYPHQPLPVDAPYAIFYRGESATKRPTLPVLENYRVHQKIADHYR